MSDLVENILKEIENKNYGLAIELCDKLISQQPNNENIYELKAGCLAALKDYKKAAECYGNAVDTAVMNKIPAADISVLHYKKGKTHLKLSEIENAAREFKAALDYNPDSDKANNDYSACLRKLDLCEEALEFANKAVMLSPNSAEYYNNRGNIYYCLGKTDESVRDYNKAIELNPGYANAYFNRGSIYFESVNDTERARQDWLRAIELNPEYRNELTQHSEAVRKLIEEKPIEDKPIEKPVEDKPVEDKPVEDKPVEDKPVEDKEKPEDISNIADKITIIPLETANEPPKEHTDDKHSEETTEHKFSEEKKFEENLVDDSSETAKVTDLFPGINETPVLHKDNSPSFSDYSDIFSSEVTGKNEMGIHDDFKIPELDFKSIFQETSGLNETEPPEEILTGKPLNIGEIKDLHDEIQKPPEQESVLSGIIPKVGPFEEIYTPQPETPVQKEPERRLWYTHPALWVVLIVIVIFSGLLAGYYYLIHLGNDASTFITQADSTLKSLTAAKDSAAPKTVTEEQKKDTAAITEQKSEEKNEPKKEENGVTKKEEPKQTETKFLGYLSDKQNFALFSEPDGYYVQIGSFKDKAAAYEKLNFLKERNVKGNVFEADIKEKGLLYRVRAGAFESQEKAKEVMQKFE